MKCILQILLFIKILSITFSQSVTLSDYDFDEEFPVEEIDKKIKSEGSQGSSSPENDEDQKEQGDANACGEPRLPEHAKVSKGDGAPYLVGDTVSFSCDFGYSADGASHTATCMKSAYSSKASWTNTTIVCNPRSCGDPGYVPNAHRIGSLFTFPNSISFECDEGYERRGSSVHYCQVNGKWSGTLPSCEKLECDVPDDPENGRVTYTSLEYASELKYECDKGFVLRNYEPRICSENGTWSGDEPICQESQCETPVPPVHGSVKVVGDARRVGSMALYKCESGLVLVGSGVSKCLEIGQWTFPTPKCVAPCSVPVITNGYIGKYENRRGYYGQQFKTITPNKALEDDEELYLRCDNKYEPLGKPASEVKISCAQGIWKEDPICVAEKCRSQPPKLENARIARYDNEHNGIAVYHCKTFYNKTKQGNVTCVFGQWQGNPPTCSDTRCYLEKLAYPGVVGQRNVYQSGETLVPTCQKGYTRSEAAKNIICNSGKWIETSQPCVPANCLKRPPSQTHGNIKSYSQQHGTKVTYECNESYTQQSSTEVWCQLGEWVGSPPQCKDSRCYFTNLKTKNGIAGPLKDPTENGQVLQFQCKNGYYMTNLRPHCSGGIWTQDDKSPCYENDCQVLKIDNGDITEIRKSTTNHWFRGQETKEERIAVKINTMVSSGRSLYVSCYRGFSFAGQGDNHILITCSQGSWNPNPVCSNSISRPYFYT